MCLWLESGTSGPRMSVINIITFWGQRERLRSFGRAAWWAQGGHGEYCGMWDAMPMALRGPVLRSSQFAPPSS